MSDIVQKLRKYLADNHDFALAFEEAFKYALTLDIPQFAEYNIHTFNDYINFYESFLTWTPSESVSGKNIYYHLCIFYFVIDLPPVKSYQTPIQPQSVPPWTWLSQWLVVYAQEIGKFMDMPASINEKSLATFYKADIYHMADYPVPPGGWKTFNEFFARHINLDVRPIDRPTDSTVIVSPADSTFDGWWPIDSKSEVTFDVKCLPWSIGQLLDGSKYKECFKDGIFMHAFLAPNDYHRQHAPVAGKVLEAKVIPGICYLQVVPVVGPDGKVKLVLHRGFEPPKATVERDGEIVAPNDPGYQFLQARGLIVLDNEDIGLVAVLPIGMAQVSSVKLKVKEGKEVLKGEELSHFEMGGSDVVVVFQAASKVKITAVKDVHYAFGKQIATAQRLTK